MKRLVLGVLLLLALSLSAPGVWAQSESSPSPNAAQSDQAATYDSWEEFASAVEGIVSRGRASNTALETLRADLVQWRTQFSKDQGQNADQIDAVKRQLEALGPNPADGSEEAPEVARKRAQLTRELADLQAPAQTASLAYSRADELIKNIDKIARNRQAQALLRLGPSPADPANWAEASKALIDVGRDLISELGKALSTPGRLTETRDKLPLIALVAALGLGALLLGRSWSRRTVQRLVEAQPTAARWLAIFALSLCGFLFPFLGVVLLIQAILISGLPGDHWTRLLNAISVAALLLLLASWIGRRVFPRTYLRPPLLNLSDEERAAGRRYAVVAGLISAYFVITQTLARTYIWSEEAYAVITAVATLLAAVLHWRTALLLRKHTMAMAAEDSAELGLKIRLANITAMLLLLVAVTAPVLTLIGYVRAGEALAMPMLWTLVLLGGILILQDLAVEIFVLLTRNTQARETLFPVLTGLLLFLLSIPVIALFWGARMQDLSESWNMFTQGFEIGGISVSPGAFLTLLLVFMLGYGMTRFIQATLQNSILPRTRIDVGGRNAIVAGTGYLGIFLAVVIAVTSAGIDLSSVAIVAGALSVGIGFGLQNIVSNFVSGIILLIERPISEGDWIDVGGHQGYVRRISVRSTRIETFDRTDVIVPNSDFVSGAVINYTRGNTVGRVIVPVGVAYGTDTQMVARILQEIAEAHPMVLAEPAPNVVFRGFGASSLDFEIRAILRDVNWVMSVHSDMNHEIARRFVEEGIEIPFPQQDVWFRNPMPRPEAKPAAATGSQASLPAASSDPAPGSGSEPIRPTEQEDGAQSEGEGDQS